MRIETVQLGEVTVVRLVTKRFDAAAVDDFKAKFNNIIQSGNRHLVLDFAAVTFIDSSGLGALISCLKTVGDNGEMVISGVSETVAALFKLTRLDRILVLYETEAEAVAAFSK